MVKHAVMMMSSSDTCEKREGASSLSLESSSSVAAELPAWSERRLAIKAAGN